MILCAVTVTSGLTTDYTDLFPHNHLRWGFMRKQPQDQPICRMQQVSSLVVWRSGPQQGPLPIPLTALRTGCKPTVYFAGVIPPTHFPVAGAGYPLITRFQVAHQLTGMFHGLSAEGHPFQ